MRPLPENENRERQAKRLQSCNPGREGDRFISLILLLFTEFLHGPFFAIFHAGNPQRTRENGGGK